MTNEEAIEIINREKKHCEAHLNDRWKSDEYYREMNLVEAYDMAIKALEAPPNEYSKRLYKSAYERGKADAEQRWIPVSERLPEDFEDVLVWYEYFRYGDYNRMFQTYGIGCYISNTGTWSGDPGTGTNVKVIAWMPLPEPMKVGEENC